MNKRSNKGITVIVLILIIIMALIILSVTGIIILKKIKKNEEKSESKEFLELVEKNSTDEKKTNGKYNSEILEKAVDKKEVDKKIIDVFGYDQKMFIATEDSIYRYSDSITEKFDKIIATKKKIESIYYIDRNFIVLKNVDKSYSKYYKKDDKYEEFNSDINFENVVFAWRNEYSKPNILVVRKEKNSFISDTYYVNDKMEIEEKILDLPLYIGIEDNGEFKKENDIKQIFCGDCSDADIVLAVLNNGKMYKISKTFDYDADFGDYDKIKTIYLGGKEPVFTEDNINQIYAGNLMEKKDNTLYYFNETKLFGYMKSSDENGLDVEKKIELPQGYTTKNIKKIIIDNGLLNCDILIQFDDNKYYTYEYSTDKFSYIEELTKLNNKNKKVFNVDYEYYVLMDDNCIYKLKI